MEVLSSQAKMKVIAALILLFAVTALVLKIFPDIDSTFGIILVGLILGFLGWALPDKK